MNYKIKHIYKNYGIKCKMKNLDYKNIWSKLYLNTRLYTRVKFWRDRQVCFRSLLADLIAGSTNVPSCVLSIHAANLHQITPQLNSAKWLHRYRMAFNNEIPVTLCPILLLLTRVSRVTVFSSFSRVFKDNRFKGNDIINANSLIQVKFNTTMHREIHDR